MVLATSPKQSPAFGAPSKGDREKGRGQSLSACYRIWKARGRPASRRTSSTVDVLALRRSLQWDGGDGGTMAKRRPTIPISHGDADDIRIAFNDEQWLVVVPRR